METLKEATLEFWASNTGAIVRTLILVVVVLTAAKVVQALARRLTERILRPREGSRDHALQQRRAQTLAPLLVEIERYVIYFVAVATVLSHLGIDTAALLASVGVVGLALGFGAQNLVKDVISGFFLLFDGLIAVGDVVQIDATTSGTVEAVGLRNTQVRDFTGLLWVLPNGDVRKFGNYNRGWTRAVVPVQIAYEADLRRARQVMAEVANTWAAENQEKVLEPPDVQGLMKLADSGIELRVVVKTRAMEHWGAERELRERIKAAFDAAGIEIPYPHQVVIRREEPASPPAKDG